MIPFCHKADFLPKFCVMILLSMPYFSLKKGGYALLSLSQQLNTHTKGPANNLYKSSIHSTFKTYTKIKWRILSNFITLSQNTKATKTCLHKALTWDMPKLKPITKFYKTHTNTKNTLFSLTLHSIFPLAHIVNTLNNLRNMKEIMFTTNNRYKLLLILI